MSTYLECGCHELPHVLQVSIIDYGDEGEKNAHPEMLIDLEFTTMPERHIWYRRIWYGLRYALGLESPYTASTLLRHEQVGELWALLQMYYRTVAKHRQEAQNAD